MLVYDRDHYFGFGCQALVFAVLFLMFKSVKKNLVDTANLIICHGHIHEHVGLSRTYCMFYGYRDCCSL